MSEHNIYTFKFNEMYKLYVNKAERKNRTAGEVDEVICWLTGYTSQELQDILKSSTDMENFFKSAPYPHPNRILVTGTICGAKLSEIDDPLMKEIRYLDKLIDELAKGKAMEKILRK